MPTVFVVLVVVKEKYGMTVFENGHKSCWIKNDDWIFGFTIFQNLGLILHCFVIIYSCCKSKKYTKSEPTKCYHSNIMKNYSTFISIYVLLWIPSIVYGVSRIAIDNKKIIYWMLIAQSGFIYSTGLANGIIWYNNKGTDPRSHKLVKINFTKSPPLLSKNMDRMGINASKIVPFTFNRLSGVNPISNINKETTSSLPLDYDPASKIGPRSMYNHDDDTPTMMLIDNTVNQHSCNITSTAVTQDDHKEQTRIF